ncbi:MAG: hypothetical protein BGO43_04115 [Gammaproteobacteria bacterium 39-13]|nr:MAG: hypothetical protein BGO43_04115 [Gammaproteobacteria bacterium 39-13]
MEEILERMRQDPQADWNIEDLVNVAKHFDVIVQRQQGYIVCSHPRLSITPTFSARRPIRVPVIRDFVDMIDSVRQ